MRATPSTITGFSDFRGNGSYYTGTLDIIYGARPGMVNVQFVGSGYPTNEVFVEYDGGTIDAEL